MKPCQSLACEKGTPELALQRSAQKNGLNYGRLALISMDVSDLSHGLFNEKDINTLAVNYAIDSDAIEFSKKDMVLETLRPASDTRLLIKK